MPLPLDENAVPDRLKKFARQLPSHKLDSYIITNDVNIRYLSGFPSSESVLIVFPIKSIYLTDPRYDEQAKKCIKGIKVEKFTHNMPKSLFAILKENNAKKAGFDDRHLSLNLFKQFKRECPHGIELVALNHVVEAMREIKEKSEISQIRACLKLNLSAYEYLRKVIRPGLTEKDVLAKLERFVRSKGADFSFPPIIASGPNSAFPHALVTDRKIRNNEPVLVDMGIDINGYKSDLTRMFFLGKMTILYKKVYEAVAIAQARAIVKIQGGVKAADVDFEARNTLENLGLAKYFTHSLGHGVGLDIHETPRLSAKSGVMLREGMVITVEPGVYLPGQFGIRLEEMVLVKKNGSEVLSRPHKLG